MTKKTNLFAIFLFIFLPMTSWSVNNFFKMNFKKIYCNNQEFLGNPGAKRPHLHCGTDFISYKKSNGDHLSIADAGNCNRTDLVFDDIKLNKSSFADYPAIYNALVLFHQAKCPNQ